MEEIRSWIEAEGAGHWYFWAFPVCLLVLFLCFRNRRVRFLIPSLLILIVIANPIFYRKWHELGQYAYWRILWIVPVIPVLAGTVACLCEKTGKQWVKVVIAAAGAGLAILGGTLLYGGTWGTFAETEYASKLPASVLHISDRLLELDDHPRVIAQDPIGIYIRQYTGNIKTMYGRDLHGYIADLSSPAKKVSKGLETGDMDTVHQIMLDEGYDFLVFSGNPGENYELVDTVDGYGIYRAAGIPSVKREWNSIGQVIGITTLDENGLPVNGENGYATLKQDFDEYGNVILEQYLDAAGRPVITDAGYAEKRCYRDDAGRLIREEYYDGNGRPCMQKDGYTAFRQTWNGQQLAERVYLGADGAPVNRKDGYSRLYWEKDPYGTRNVKYYDVQGNEISTDGLNLIRDLQTGDDGWSLWMTPDPDTRNSCFTVGTANLGEKAEGDVFSCDLEIEFRNVQAGSGDFWFRTQGAVDGTWKVYNLWNNIIDFEEPPKDGVYTYHTTYSLKENMARASEYDIAFRCDDWKCGSFRVRNVRIQKEVSDQ